MGEPEPGDNICIISARGQRLRAEAEAAPGEGT